MSDEEERGILGLGLLCVIMPHLCSPAALRARPLCALRALNNNFFTGTIPPSVGWCGE